MINVPIVHIVTNCRSFDITGPPRMVLLKPCSPKMISSSLTANIFMHRGPEDARLRYLELFYVLCLILSNSNWCLSISFTCLQFKSCVRRRWLYLRCEWNKCIFVNEWLSSLNSHDRPLRHSIDGKLKFLYQHQHMALCVSFCSVKKKNIRPFLSKVGDWDLVCWLFLQNKINQGVMVGGRQPFVKDSLWWKMTFSGDFFPWQSQHDWAQTGIAISCLNRKYNLLL